MVAIFATSIQFHQLGKIYKNNQVKIGKKKGKKNGPGCFSNLFWQQPIGTSVDLSESIPKKVGGKVGMTSSWKQHVGIQSPYHQLPETNSSHLKMGGWNTILSFWGKSLFSGALAVSFRVCKPLTKPLVLGVG